MDQEPTLFYTVDECIGRGTFGDVYKGTQKASGKVVAIKVVNLDESTEEIEVLLQEIIFLSQLRSEFITNYYNTYLKNNAMWIVMEYCQGGSCSELIRCYGRLEEGIVALIMKNSLHGLVYLHKQQLVHRDIKAANILLSAEGQVKLADFGVSGELTSSERKKKHTFVGTPLWMAPEVILRSKEGYNEKCDIWSLGITAIELIKGSPPHADKPPMKVLFEIPKLEAPSLVGPKYSKQAKSFVNSCLAKSPAERWSAKTLLNHPFIQTFSASNEDLVTMITTKNEIMGIKAKKPRYELDTDGTSSTSAPVEEWEFTSRFELKKPPNLVWDITVPETDSVADLPSSSSPKMSPPLNGNDQQISANSNIKSSKHLSKKFSRLHEKFNSFLVQLTPSPKENSGSPEKNSNSASQVLNPIHPNIGLKDSLDKVSSPHRRHRNTKINQMNQMMQMSNTANFFSQGMIYKAFDNMQRRANTETIRVCCEEFALIFKEVEEEVPGISKAFCEELSKVFAQQRFLQSI